MNWKRNFFLVGVILLAASLAGCGDAPLPESAHKTLKDHIDTSITPQQRIQRIQNDPHMTEAQKTTFIAHIKANNHLN